MSCLRIPARRGFVLLALILAAIATSLAGAAAAIPASAATVPTTPTGLTAAASGSTVTLDWADNTDAGFAYFAVRRSTQPDPSTGTWTRLAPNFPTSQAVDSGLAPGTYYYYVTAVNTVNAVSARSAVVKVVVGTTAPAPSTSTPTAPAPSTNTSTMPTGVTVSVTGSTANLDWNDSADPKFAYFAVRRGTQADPATGTWTRLATNYTSSQASDSGLAAGTYYYYITAVDTAGVVSPRSAVVQAVVSGSTSGTSSPGTSSPGTSTPGSSTLSPLTKVLTVVEENHSMSEMQSGMPYLYGLAKQYGYSSNFTALTHPSLPNYLGIAGGSTFGVTDDAAPASHPLNYPTVFGQALAAGKTAKTYAESMPSNCALTSSGLYAVKHNPWAYFTPERTSCAKFDVPLGSPTSGALVNDIAANALPNVGMVIPNMCNDAHDCSLSVADGWLKGWLPKVLASSDFTSGKLAVIITADEDSGQSGNKILTVVLHASLKGKVVTTALTHYSLTRLYAELAHVAPLRGGATAPSLAQAFGLTIG